MNDTDIVFIVGMHRSGTSLVSELLESAGYHFGDNLIGKAADNPRGFWEDKELIAINDRLLGGENQWQAIYPRKPDAQAQGLAKIHAGLWLNKLAGTLPDNRLAFKDPRLCRTLDFWLDVLPQGAKAIFVWRHPMAVAKSLCKRNGMPLPKGILLWALYNYEALRSLSQKGTAHTIIEYDALIHSPEKATKAILDFTGSEGIDALRIDESLNHSQQTQVADVTLSPIIQEFSQALLERIQSGRTGTVHELAGLYGRAIAELGFADASLPASVGHDAPAQGNLAEQLPTKQLLAIIGHRIFYNRNWGPLNKPLRFCYRSCAFLLNRGFHTATPAQLPCGDLLSGRKTLPHAPAARVAEDDLPEITLSIVTYNNGHWVAPFLRSLRNQHYPPDKIHIHFVDNGSTDETPRILKEAEASHRGLFAGFTITSQENLGFGMGHDVAIRAANTDFVLVTNIDLVFEKRSLHHVVAKALRSSPETASWELRQKPYEHPKYVDPVTLRVSWSSHACILLRRQTYLEVGGYEPRIFMYGEDVELSYRFRRAGYHLEYVPGASVYHYTYSVAHEIKPLQFKGSIQANHFIRLRYGSFRDMLVSFLQIAQLSRKKYRAAGLAAPAKAAQREALKQSLYFLSSRKRSKAAFPFHGFDYELARKGAFTPQLFLDIEDYTDSLPRVTVVTRTVKGRAGLLGQCISSVMNQTYPKIEHLIVEDGGNSAAGMVGEWAQYASDSYAIRHIETPKKGRSHAGNAGMAAAQGDYLLFLDDDDLIFPDHVETLVSGIITGATQAAYSLAWDVKTVMKDKETADYEEKAYISHPLFAQQVTYDLLKQCNCFPIQCVLFAKTLFAQYGGFDEGRECLEDWILWRKYALYTHFHYIGKTTSLYRTPASAEEEKKRAELFRSAYIKLQESAQP